MVIRYVFAFLVACALLQPANAQPTLIFKRVEVMYPKIRLAFKVTCGGTFRNDLQPQHFEVYENGLPVKNATLWCPQEPDCCVSVALVFDRSGSMLGPKIENVKIGGAAFVNSMNPDGLPCDEAAVISFNEDVTLDVGMTSNKPQLLSAINAMKALGRTAVWDAIGVGVQELTNSGTNRCRAVVVLTDGGDNESQFLRTAQAVAQFAIAQDVKVYTIGYEVADTYADAALRYIANATGGEYYRTGTGQDLAQIYANIKQSVKEAFQECYIEYETGCPDGSQRVVELQLKNYCGGSATQTRTYIAPLDRSQFQPIGLRIDDGEVASTKDIVIPVILETPVNGIFGKCSFSIGYDRNVMQLTNVTIAGTLLEGKKIGVQLPGSGAIITVLENMELHTTGGVMCYLHFRAGDVAQRTYTPIELINWTFDAYCLIPQLHNGRLIINPREPLLTCEVAGPDALTWNDQEKRYEPNPFNVSITVMNSGTKEAWNVRATIVTDPSIVDLVTPTTTSQLLTPRTIPPGGIGTAQWTLRATKQENLDSIPVYFSVQADNHPGIACWKRILVDPALSSAIVCDLSAPDTIFFREQYYEPEEFNIHVMAHNVGSGQTRDVRAQLLQDTRFTIVPPASQDLAAVLLPNESAADTFRVRIHPRDTDGYDTVRVNVQGDDTNPAWCQYPIWVQRVRMPEFTLTCATPIDSLVFNDATYEYEPNPFTVTTVATNIGETYAEDCIIMLAGPPRFTPIGTNLRPEGTMQIGDKRSEQWSIRALPRTEAAWDTLVFQVLGRGGLGKQIVIAECRLPVYVPAVRRPEYELTCSAPDSMSYVDNRYQPDPLPFSLHIKNVGNAAGRGLSPTIIPPPSVSLADGEAAERYIPALGVGESVDLTWNLTPEMRANDGDYRICAQVVDSIGISEQCCTDVFIPKTENPILMPSCWSIDTLFLDSQTGSYLGNPFEVVLNLTNVGLGAATNVNVSLSVLGSFMQLMDPMDQHVGDLDPGVSVRITWKVKALKRDLPADVPFVITVTADNHASRECQVEVFVPAMQTPILQTVCSSFPEDSLFFDWDTGTFEYTECSLTFTVTNVGAVNAQNVTALLIPPSGVSLITGEETLKPVDPSVLEPGGSGTVTWKFRAMRSNENMIREFRFIARADNADDAVCTDDLFVEGSPKHVTLSFPDYTLLRYGEKQDIPIYIDRTIGKNLSEYVLHFYYDESVLHVLGVSNAGTLTGIGWVGAKIKPWGNGHLEISDYTTGSPLARDAGILLKLQVEGVFNENSGISGYGESVLHIDSAMSVLNRGDIFLSTRDGRVIATNQCLEPLVATEQYVLRQNRPNPFNPETVIEFILPRDDHIRLIVFDRHGREVTVLAEGQYAKGNHFVRFSGEQYPSGLYFYRLETSRKFEVRKMILSR
ncbi:MAG: VWA domain-containing protein [Bacteroidetes bacterium]|nr:VWA domain-containing protein [Bacteroidota bacterium]